MHDPLTPVNRQIDFVVARHIFQQPLDVWFLHKTEAHLDSDNAASSWPAVKHGHPIAIVPDVGDLWVRNFDEDEVMRQDAVSLP